MTAFTNWNRSATSRPSVDVAPRDLPELVEIVRDKATFPSPVRPAGKLHSTTFCIDADAGTQVRMDRFRSIEMTAGGVRITVGAGVTMLEIRDALRPHGRELAVSPEIGNATAGSVACSGSKDSWLRFRGEPGLAQIGSAVAGVRMVDARGEVWTVDGDGAADAAGRRHPTLTLALVRSSYGLLGIVFEVTFETVPLVLLRNRFHWLPLHARDQPGTIAIPSLDEVFDGADAVLGFMQPYSRRFLLERRMRAMPLEQPTAEDEFRRAVRDWIWEWGASEATTFTTALAALLAGRRSSALRQLLATAVEAVSATAGDNPFRRLTGGVLDKVIGQAAGFIATLVPRDSDGEVLRDLTEVARAAPATEHTIAAWLLRHFDHLAGPFFQELLGGYLAHRSDSLVDFTDQRSTFFDFTFWAFPQRDWQRIVAEYIGWCDQQVIAQNGYRPALFTEVYFICQDAHPFLSFSDAGPVFTLDIVDNRPTSPEWRRLNQEYNRWAVQHGRPLLNQTKELQETPGVVRQAYGAAWDRFSAEVWAANPPLPGEAPNGRLVSGYFAKLLTPRTPGGGAA